MKPAIKRKEAATPPTPSKAPRNKRTKETTKNKPEDDAGDDDDDDDDDAFLGSTARSSNGKITQTSLKSAGVPVDF